MVGIYGGTVIYCYNEGSVKGEVSTGGIVGSSDGIVKLCANSGYIYADGTAKHVGGIVGYQRQNGSIENCYNIGNIQGDIYVGGITGACNNPSDRERYYTRGCYNTGMIRATSNVAMGAIAGECKSYMSDCYYLEGTCSYGVKDLYDGQQPIVKTSDELKMAYNLLGSSWMQDTNNTNNGYPILRDNIIYTTDYRLIDKPEWIGDITSDSNYYWFELDGTSLRPTNSLKNLAEDSWAKSYFTIDLSNYSTTDTLQIIFNAEISSELGHDYGYIAINDSKVDINSYSTDEYYNEEDDVYYDYISGLKTSDGNDITQFIANSGDVERKNYKTTLLGGKKYYIYLGYIKNSSVDYGKDAIIVNDITLTKL